MEGGGGYNGKDPKKISINMSVGSSEFEKKNLAQIYEKLTQNATKSIISRKLEENKK